LGHTLKLNYKPCDPNSEILISDANHHNRGKMSEVTRQDLPSWQFFIKYVLEALSDGEIKHRKTVGRLAKELAPLTPEQREIRFDGGEPVSEHRAGWAMSALTRAKCVEKPSRGYFRITNEGRGLLRDKPAGITEKDLMEMAAWSEYEPTKRNALGSNSSEVTLDHDGDPIERISSAVKDLDQGVASELLGKLRGGSPEFFEKAVLDLLAAMGYGGVEKNRTHTGKSGDGGIDGVLDQDALGLTRVHVQAKRYADGNTVGRPDIQQFIGALGDKSATQGVFVTSSRFSREALETADRAGEKIALIDGNRLVELMIEIVEIDEDFFE
jgi:restriction system protein